MMYMPFKHKLTKMLQRRNDNGISHYHFFTLNPVNQAPVGGSAKRMEEFKIECKIKQVAIVSNSI